MAEWVHYRHLSTIFPTVPLSLSNNTPYLFLLLPVNNRYITIKRFKFFFHWTFQMVVNE